MAGEPPAAGSRRPEAWHHARRSGSNRAATSCCRTGAPAPCGICSALLDHSAARSGGPDGTGFPQELQRGLDQRPRHAAPLARGAATAMPQPQSLPQRLVLACFNQHIGSMRVPGAVADLLGSRGELEVRTLDYGRWVSGEDGDVDLWRVPSICRTWGPFATAGCRAPPCCAGCGPASRPCGEGLTRWRALVKSPAPRPAGRVQRQSWFVPLFHPQLELSRTGVHGGCG